MTVPTLQCSTHYLFMFQVYPMTIRTVVLETLCLTHMLVIPGKHNIILQTHCAIVQVITMDPHHQIWQRCCRRHHGEAIRQNKTKEIPDCGCTDILLSHLPLMDFCFVCFCVVFCFYLHFSVVKLFFCISL